MLQVIIMTKLKSIFPIVILLFIVCTVFSPYLFGYIGITPNVGTNDNVDLQVPFRQVLQESLLKRRLPLWEPRISTGFPLFAEGQIGALYLPNLLFAALPVPAYYSVSLSIVFAVFLSAVNMYFFLNEFLNNRGEEHSSRNRVFALIGAIFWSQAGVQFNHTAHLNVLNVFSWLPFELWIIERRLNEKDSYFKTVGLLALPVMLQIFAGHPQFASYCFLFIALYWFLNQVMLKTTLKFNALLLNGLVVGGAILLGILLASVQLFPTVEFTFNSTRQTGLDEESINFLAFRVQDLRTLVTPFYDFSYEPRTPARLDSVSWPFDERYSYFGLIPLSLAMLSIAFVIRKRQALVFLILGVMFLLLSLGNQTPIGGLLKIPPLNLFRIPTKFTTLAQLSFVILATYGLKSMIELLIRPKGESIAKNVRIGLAVLVILTSLDTGTKLYKLYPIQKGEWWYEKPETVKVYEKELQKNPQGKIIGYQNYRIFGQDYNIQMHKQYLEQDPKLWDTLQMQVFKNNRAILPAFDMLTYDVPLVDNAVNSAGLKVKWYSQIEKQIFFAPSIPADNNTVDYNDQYWKFLRLTGTKYLLHNDNLSLKNVELVGKTNYTTGQDQIAIYKLKNPLPFIHTPQNIHKVDDEQTYQAVSGIQFNPATEIIIPKTNSQQVHFNTNSNPTEISVKQPVPEQLQINVTNASPTLIFISQTYFPGWTATVDGQSVPVIRANHAFQAVSIPDPGTHTIELQYQPQSLRIGLYITTAALVVYIGILIFDTIAHKSRPNTQP